MLNVEIIESKNLPEGFSFFEFEGRKVFEPQNKEMCEYFMILDYDLNGIKSERTIKIDSVDLLETSKSDLCKLLRLRIIEAVKSIQEEVTPKE